MKAIPWPRENFNSKRICLKARAFYQLILYATAVLISKLNKILSRSLKWLVWTTINPEWSTETPTSIESSCVFSGSSWWANAARLFIWKNLLLCSIWALRKYSTICIYIYLKSIRSISRLRKLEELTKWTDCQWTASESWQVDSGTSSTKNPTIREMIRSMMSQISSK